MAILDRDTLRKLDGISYKALDALCAGLSFDEIRRINAQELFDRRTDYLNGMVW